MSLLFCQKAVTKAEPVSALVAISLEKLLS